MSHGVAGESALTVDIAAIVVANGCFSRYDALCRT